MSPFCITSVDGRSGVCPRLRGVVRHVFAWERWMRSALVLILGCGLSWGQRVPPMTVASVEGQVIDARSERPVKRVEVVLNGAGDAKLRVGVLTDPDGQFSFRDVAPGRYTLTAMREGFLPASSVVVAGVRRPLNLVLEGARSGGDGGEETLGGAGDGEGEIRGWGGGGGGHDAVVPGEV